MRLIVAFLNLIAAVCAGSSNAEVFSFFRIVGGQDVNVIEYKYMASLRKSGAHHCGSAILSERWAITAAHCFYNEELDEFTLRTGSSNRLSDGVYRDIKTVIIHPQFDAENIDYDIALIEMAEPIDFDNKTASISLPASGYNIRSGTMASVIGWGYLSEEGPLSINLQRAFVPIVDWRVCKNMYKGYRNVSKRMICAGFMEGNKDACQSDSGGPLILNGCLIGLISWGRGCARPLSPGVYSNIAFFKHWIFNITSL